MWTTPTKVRKRRVYYEYRECRAPAIVHKALRKGRFVVYTYLVENLDAALDKWFSIYIRLRRADYRGVVHCYTCPTLLHWQQAQCGHFIRRGNDTTRWHEDNARPQCPHCNLDLNGCPDVFEEELRAEIGDDATNAVIALGRQIDTRSTATKYALLAYYKRESKKLGYPQ